MDGQIEDPAQPPSSFLCTEPLLHLTLDSMQNIPFQSFACCELFTFHAYVDYATHARIQYCHALKKYDALATVAIFGDVITQPLYEAIYSCVYAVNVPHYHQVQI